MTSRRSLILILVGVCILSATIGSGVTLLAKTGPAGPRGEIGPEGPAGESAEEARDEASEALSRVDDLEATLGDIEGRLPAFGRAVNEDELYGLEGSISQLESNVSALCRGLRLVC